MNNQKINPDPKGKATASLILGILSILPPILFLFSLFVTIVAPGLIKGTYGPSPFVAYTFLLLLKYSPFSGLIGIVGIILGEKSIKSTKRKFAITGIVLSLIGVVISSYIFISNLIK